MLQKTLHICVVGLIFFSLTIYAQEPLKVIATFSILADFIKNVGGDLVEVTTLVGADGDAHEYEPSPRDSVAIANAALIFENGLLFETWLDDLYTVSGSSATRVVVSEGIIPLVRLEEEHDEDQESEDRSEFDPHLWQDPQLVMTMVDNVAAALSNIDPDNQASYLANAANYKAELEQLDKDLQTQANTLPVEQRKLITNHDAIAYFAYRYGFEVIGVVMASASSDVNAGGMAKLVELIKEAKVSAIFVENISNSNVLEQLAVSAGVKVAPALYTDALGPEDSEGETYLEMMRYNMTTIIEALRAGER
jgi:zinc/manganese transport system substrate-binding protein